MKLPAIIERSRFKSGISNTTTLTYTQLSALCYDGHKLLEREIVKLNQDYFEEQKSVFSLIALSSLYSLPTDYLSIKQLRLAYTTPTSESDYKVATPSDAAVTKDVTSQETSISSSTPIFDITGSYFRIMPKPDSASTSGGQLYYFASTVLSGSATPSYPIEYHTLVATYAAKEVCMKFEKWDKYKVLDKEWAEGIAKLRDDLATKNVNENKRVRNILEDGSAKTTTELF